MCAKGFRNPFPIHKLNRKSDFKRRLPIRNEGTPRGCGRGETGISRRDTPKGGR